MWLEPRSSPGDIQPRPCTDLVHSSHYCLSYIPARHWHYTILDHVAQPSPIQLWTDYPLAVWSNETLSCQLLMHSPVKKTIPRALSGTWYCTRSIRLTQ
ncbi:hypothetical protein RSAG8_12484, partial [Rhizoctonia solani AG-8 WAC10335]